MESATKHAGASWISCVSMSMQEGITDVAGTLTKRISLRYQLVPWEPIRYFTPGGIRMVVRGSSNLLVRIRLPASPTEIHCSCLIR
jgi:hypothetical protein